MYTLYFPNGNVQTYPSESILKSAVRAMGGEAKEISRSERVFVFVD